MTLPNVTRDTLCHEVTSRTGKTREEAQATLRAFLAVLAGHLAQGESTQIRGFGTWYPRDLAARAGARNPRTMEAVPIPAQRVARWRPSAWLKEQIQLARGRA